MSLPKATITVDGPHGRRASVAIDGIPIQFSVSHAELVLDVNDVNRLTVEHMVHIDEVEVEAVVTFRATMARTGQPYSGYIAGEGETPRLAVVAMLEKMP